MRIRLLFLALVGCGAVAACSGNVGGGSSLPPGQLPGLQAPVAPQSIPTGPPTPSTVSSTVTVGDGSATAAAGSRRLPRDGTIPAVVVLARAGQGDRSPPTCRRIRRASPTTASARGCSASGNASRPARRRCSTSRSRPIRTSTIAELPALTVSVPLSKLTDFGDSPQIELALYDPAEGAKWLMGVAERRTATPTPQPSQTASRRQARRRRHRRPRHRPRARPAYRCRWSRRLPASRARSTSASSRKAACSSSRRSRSSSCCSSTAIRPRRRLAPRQGRRRARRHPAPVRAPPRPARLQPQRRHGLRLRPQRPPAARVARARRPPRRLQVRALPRAAARRRPRPKRLALALRFAGDAVGFDRDDRVVRALRHGGRHHEGVLMLGAANARGQLGRRANARSPRRAARRAASRRYSGCRRRARPRAGRHYRRRSPAAGSRPASRSVGADRRGSARCPTSSGRLWSGRRRATARWPASAGRGPGRRGARPRPLANAIQPSRSRTAAVRRCGAAARCELRTTLDDRFDEPAPAG